MSNDAKIMIDGKEYLLSELSDIARSQLVNLQVVDQKINALSQDLQIMQVARAQFAKLITEALPKKD